MIEREDRTMGKYAAHAEWWIEAAALKKRGWLAMPRHARGGRHASPATRRGRRVLDRLHGERHAWRHVWSAAREAVAS